MNVIHELQDWYQSQCDGDWEHDYGVSIMTLDNPGWRVKINLVGTALENRPFSEISRLDLDHDWIRCWIEDGCYCGVGDTSKLENIIGSFLAWANNG